jgi:hypothetical protein
MPKTNILIAICQFLDMSQSNFSTKVLMLGRSIASFSQYWNKLFVPGVPVEATYPLPRGPAYPTQQNDKPTALVHSHVVSQKWHRHSLEPIAPSCSTNRV